MKDNKTNKKVTNVHSDEKISRKEALKKAGLVAFSAGTMLLLLSKSEKAMAQDSAFNPDDPDTW
ncbi:MAG: hypothetical protein WD577_05970 [Bacteroidales bacterium]